MMNLEATYPLVETVPLLGAGLYCMHSKGGPSFWGCTYVDEFYRWTPFWGLYVHGVSRDHTVPILIEIHPMPGLMKDGLALRGLSFSFFYKI